jgi:hypothetical protein
MSARGEVTIQLGGADYILLPSFEAVDKIEQQTGRSIMDLATAGQSLSQHDLAVIVTEGIRAHGRDQKDPLKSAYNVKSVGELIFAERDRVRLTRDALLFLLNIVQGGAAPKKPEPETGPAMTGPCSGS